MSRPPASSEEKNMMKNGIVSVTRAICVGALVIAPVLAQNPPPAGQSQSTKGAVIKGKAPVNIVMKLVGLGIALALIPNTSLGARAMADAAFGKLNVKVLVNVYGTSVAKLGMLVLACISRVPTVGVPEHISGQNGHGRLTRT